MASIDKTSVRAEVNRLKSDFEQLCADGKITNEIKAIMSSMLMILELMLSFLNERLRRIIKTPANPHLKLKKMSPRYLSREVMAKVSMKMTMLPETLEPKRQLRSPTSAAAIFVAKT